MGNFVIFLIFFAIIVDNYSYFVIYFLSQVIYGCLAQLVRAPALQAGGHRFESYSVHHCRLSVIGSATDL